MNPVARIVSLAAVAVLSLATAQRADDLDAMTRQQLTVRMNDYGLGLALSGTGAARTFGHNGRDQGFDALMLAFAETGQGVVVMINANDNSGMMNRIVDAVARKYKWPERSSSGPAATKAVPTTLPLETVTGMESLRRAVTVTGFALGVLFASPVAQQRNAAVWERALQEKPRFLDTLKELVSIESGSSDPAGLSRVADLIAARLRALGGEVRQVAPPADMMRFYNTPAQPGSSVVAQFRGSGATRILLLAHMDTVYRSGMLGQQPFRIDGDRAYGLGIADNKQGVALVLHTVSMVKALSSRFGLITVLITADEEVSSPASRALLTQLGSEHDLVLSCEGLTEDEDILLSTMGTGAVQLTVRGRASHAGLAPEEGRNALYELAHQLLQTRDLSDAAAGVKMNWTVAAAGTARNVIPAEARATADIRVTKLSGYDHLERQIHERVKHQLVADAQVDVVLERLRPPLEVREPSRRAAAQARRVYGELGVSLAIQEAPFAATDAAFAGLRTKAAVLEGMGVRGSGAHSSDAEYIVVSSIERRLYLLTRLIMDSADGALALQND